MSLLPEVRAQYVAIIDSILADADLTTISVKQVRNGIQSKVQYDITPHKSTINDMIHERFNIAEAKLGSNGVKEEEPIPSVEAAEPQTNGVHKSEDSAATPSRSSTSPKHEASSDEMSDIVEDGPPKKKRKAGTESDAALAARLQMEENQTARPTRGGATRKQQPGKKKKTPKKKSRARVSGSESDLDDGQPKKPRNTGFHKPLNLSPQLSMLVGGEAQMSRPQVTKKIWEHIKSKDLQDPADKRFILCDDAMREVFKQDRVHMFQMTKLVNQQMYSPDE